METKKKKSFGKIRDQKEKKAKIPVVIKHKPRSLIEGFLSELKISEKKE